jgi:gamma-glutamylcyclotransferase (GGCT)/AIG2-like uncharacterized protein YtfP
MSALVFVYGTLKSGYGNNEFHLGTSEFVGEAVVADATLMAVSSFPGAIEAHGEHVKGEVWRVDEQTLARLDRLEGCPHMYERRLVPTKYGDAWMYFWVSRLYPDTPWLGPVWPGDRCGGCSRTVPAGTELCDRCSREMQAEGFGDPIDPDAAEVPPTEERVRFGLVGRLARRAGLT